jgi:hypothetical protein
MARFMRFAYAVTSSAAIILLLTFGTYSLHLWVGDHPFTRDNIFYMFALFPLVIGLVAQMWPSPHRSCPPFAAGAAGAVVGLVYGYVVARLGLAMYLLSMGSWNWGVLGPIGWDIDLGVSVCGVVAGTCALLLSITARSRRVIATVAILILTAVLVPAPAFDLITQNQELTVVVAVPYSPDATNERDAIAYGYSTPVEDGRLIDHVLGWLREEGITGQYRVYNQGRFGHGKRVLAVIVFNQPVVSKVELPQPRGSDVIYLQQPDGWKKIPPKVRTLGRSLTLEPSDNKDALARFTIHEGGGRGSTVWISKTPE